jgi:hypothetical protein
MWYGRELNSKILVSEEIKNIKRFALDLSAGKPTNLHRLTATELIWWNTKLL